jgi:nucleotide-binding universal stress UspA family protein
MIAPIFAHFAATAVRGNLDKGTGIALFIGMGVALLGAGLGVAVYLLSGARPQTPDLDRFLEGSAPAWYSPPLLAAVRGGAGAPSAPAVRAPSVAPLSTPVAQGASNPSSGPVLIAYDGSQLAEQAIEQAGSELEPGREALVLVVWQPVDVGFTPVNGTHFDADQAVEVHQVAAEAAAHGVMLAQRAGFVARPLTVAAAPTWKGIVTAAERYDASLIVMGHHRRRGVGGHLAGSVAAAVEEHADVPVLIVPQPV